MEPCITDYFVQRLLLHFGSLFSGCPALRQPPLEIVTLGPYTLHDYCSRVRVSASTGVLDLTGVPVKRLPAAALQPDTLHTLLLCDTLIEVRHNTLCCVLDTLLTPSYSLYQYTTGFAFNPDRLHPSDYDIDRCSKTIRLQVVNTCDLTV